MFKLGNTPEHTSSTQGELQNIQGREETSSRQARVGKVICAVRSLLGDKHPFVHALGAISKGGAVDNTNTLSCQNSL